VPRDGQPWRQPVDAPGPRRNRHALREIMEFWLSLGIAGFRCDMAYSLVKDDAGFVATGQVWRETRAWLERRHPLAVLIAEWGQPSVSLRAGFHADFFLHFMGDAMRSLWDNGEGVRRDGVTPLVPYFHADGGGCADTFVAASREVSDSIASRGYAILPTSNHDFSRLACGRRTGDELKAAFAMQMTWPTLPAVYYGDEIGMRFIDGLPDKEGSRLGPHNNRAGSRTPMQWDDTANAGFSTAAPERLYLPVDPDPDRPIVAAQRADDRSLLNTVRALIALRRAHSALGVEGDLRVLCTGYPLVYVRGGRYLVVVNPCRSATALSTVDVRPARLLLGEGIEVRDGTIRAAGHGYAIFEI
jgi:glycosidase